MTIRQLLSSRLELACLPNAVGWARRHTGDVLTNWRVPPDAVETAKLLASELATNVVQHTAGPERLTYPDLAEVYCFELTLRLEGSRLFIEVYDDDRTPPALRQVGTDSESGRGLFLIHAMSAEWGYYHPSPTSGKVVWCEVALPSANAVNVTEQVVSSTDGQVPRTRSRGTGRPDALLMGRVLVGLHGQ